MSEQRGPLGVQVSIDDKASEMIERIKNGFELGASNMRIALRNSILKKVDDEAMRKVIEFRRYYTVIRERGG